MADVPELFVKGDTEGEYVQYEQPTFVDQIPENHRESDVFKDVTNVSELAERHVQLNDELAGLRSAQLPEAYEIPDIPEEIRDTESLEAFTNLAKELGLSQEVFNKLMDFDTNRAERYNTLAKEAHENMIEDGKNALRERWGTKHAEYMEQSQAGLRKVLAAFKDGEELEKELTNAGFLDIPSVVRIFRKVGQATSEDVFTKGELPPDEIPRGDDGRPLLTYPSMKGMN